jgi:cell division protein ZapA
VKPDDRGIEVTILDRTFRIACKEEEKEALQKAVQYLDLKMREIRDGGKVIGAERIAVMAGLNIAHELLSMQLTRGFDMGEFKRRMHSMAAAIDEAMSAQDDLF